MFLRRMTHSALLLASLLSFISTKAAAQTHPTSSGRTLVKAIETGDVAAVRSLLASGVDGNGKDAQDEGGGTALMLAGERGEEEIVRALLAKGADANARAGQGGTTALMWTVMHGHASVAALLLKAGADPHLRDGHGRDALLYAALGGDVAAIQTLIGGGLDVNEADSDGMTPLFMAAEKGSLPAVKLLLSRGANPKAHGNHDQTALLAAAIGGNTDVIALLKASGAKASDGDSLALLGATLQGNLNLVQGLLTAGADPKMKGSDGETPLIFAVNPSLSDELSAKIVLTLVKAGTDVNARDSHNMTALMSAALNGKPATTRALIDNGADMEVRNPTTGATPLILAVSNFVTFPGADQIGTVKTLLAKGANTEATNKKGRTALMEAAAHGTAAMVSLLLTHGAQVNARDASGKTALMQAAQQGQIEVTRALLAHKADVDAKDHSGKTALNWTDGPIEITRTVFTITKAGEAPTPPPSGSDADDKQQLGTIGRDRLVVAKLLKQSGAKQ